MKLKIYRTGGSISEPRYDTFEMDVKQGANVLSALFLVQDNIDDSLSFRYSCRGAVCGTCAMLINKVPRLACRTQIDSLLAGKDEVQLKHYPALEVQTSWDSSEEILIEPLPHLKVLKDLVVDMNKFFKFYKAVKPVLQPGTEQTESERLMEKKSVNELEKYTNCILCAACVGACPINAQNEDYLGPAALAKLYRFHIDPREKQDDSRLLLANSSSGWWGCKFHTNCKRVCPKDVPPNLAIGSARKQLQKKGLTPEENVKKKK